MCCVMDMLGSLVMESLIIESLVMESLVSLVKESLEGVTLVNIGCKG